ncbi:MAG: peptidoglycan DD-metalloendopeptidase family protein [Myxococcales bacterium]|nr:peptidoglycan DD-metalloendopeptidase family protein [Myxococcales bacterium]MCB9508275.1 peptidoglycan DD-metalloendopeptidase family protein [Myxococcales bacterium]
MDDRAVCWLLLGGGALGLVALRPRRAAASGRLFALARPTPADVRTVVSSGWARPRGDRLHRALDLPVPLGTPIHAVDAGIVVRVQGEDAGDAGRWVGIRHPSGLTSRYLHLSKPLVELDARVERDAVVGLSGSTGNSAAPHLHLELRAPLHLLAAIERAVGKPHSGWGPAMAPYGYSIPGEPWVPVDGYRSIVESEARDQGIPLHGSAGLRNRSTSLTYRSVGSPGEPYPSWLRALRGNSGVYIIRDRSTREIVYVGESSTGRLFETLTRHLQSWRRWKGYWRGQYAEGHDPGLTYPRDSVEVAVRATAPADALDEEARLIRRLRPRDNLIGQPADEEAVPF